MLDVLLPRTDGGVAFQAIIAVVALAGLAYGTRRHPDLRVLVAGLAVMTVALFGLRMVH